MTGKWMKPPEATGFRIVPYGHFEAAHANHYSYILDDDIVASMRQQ